MYTPPSPPSWAEGIFKGEGGGVVYFEAPQQQDFYTPPPPLLCAPHPRRVFSGVGGRYIKVGPIGMSRAACFRDGETTIKIKFAVFSGVGHAGQRGKSSKTLFFVGNVTTIKF